MPDIEVKRYPLLLSNNYPNSEQNRSKITKFVTDVENAEPSADVTMKKILLQETLLLDEDVEFLQLQVDSMEVQFLATGPAYEHGAAFALAFLTGYLITVVTQLYKDKDRFFAKDFDQRIELAKLKLKFQQEKSQKLMKLAGSNLSPDSQTKRDQAEQDIRSFISNAQNSQQANENLNYRNEFQQQKELKKANTMINNYFLADQ